jgi:hypothetical protein
MTTDLLFDRHYEIVARVDALSERVAILRARQEASLAELEKLGKSILAKAFLVV